VPSARRDGSIACVQFSKPSFDALLESYDTDPESVHACPFIHTKDPVNVNTCAIRMGEALVLATGLVADRDAIEALTRGAGDGHAFLLGHYAYRALLCPHGISRGAHDLADFLRAQWGDPTRCWTAQETNEAAPGDAQGRKGLIAFVGIPTFGGQGHIDLWSDDGPVGHQYWSSKQILLWELP
jgi:hypothetical protein